ncbi:MAG: DUF542 domain-containing protein [Anaerolineae bacterium]|nr:DUF542 domain-containing protein [Anaerolineae bacterium]
MTIDMSVAEKNVGDVVAADYRAAAVFDKYGIDFYGRGQTSVKQACLDKGVAVASLLQDLEQVEQAPGSAERHDQWALDVLSDYIVKEFHIYTKDMFPRITEQIEAVASAHGDAHPETRTIAALWPGLKGEMAMHMQREELLLFPYIKRLMKSEAEGITPKKPPFGTAKDLIDKMEAEHDSSGNVLLEMERVSRGYEPPEDASPAYRALYADLKEFEAATKKHFHMENNVLFPKSIELERKLLAE